MSAQLNEYQRIVVKSTYKRIKLHLGSINPKYNRPDQIINALELVIDFSKVLIEYLERQQNRMT